MLLVAAITDRTDDHDVAFTRLPECQAGHVLVIDERGLNDRMWHGLDGGHRRPLDATSVRIPVWACLVDRSTTRVTFYATALWRPATTTLTAFHHIDMPAPAPTDLTTWASRVVGELAHVNLPLPRPGQRPLPGPEVEAKITITGHVNPLAIALMLQDHLTTIAVPASDRSLHRRILRSEIYLPAGTGRQEYAALTPRPDGTWWVKTKALHDGRLHKNIRPADNHQHALTLANDAFGPRPLDRVGQLHRSTWDLISPADQGGHWSTITVDTTTLAPNPTILQQVEIEYGGCLAAAPATVGSPESRQAVGTTTDAVAAVLTSQRVPYTRPGQSKIEHFLTEGRADARD
jgi:hypothetical protein